MRRYGGVEGIHIHVDDLANGVHVRALPISLVLSEDVDPLPSRVDATRSSHSNSPSSGRSGFVSGGTMTSMLPGKGL